MHTKLDNEPPISAMDEWFADVLMVFEDISANWGMYHALTFLEHERDIHIAEEACDQAIWIRDLIYSFWLPRPLS